MSLYRINNEIMSQQNTAIGFNFAAGKEEPFE